MSEISGQHYCKKEKEILRLEASLFGNPEDSGDPSIRKIVADLSRDVLSLKQIVWMFGGALILIQLWNSGVFQAVFKMGVVK
jgi:hypothetical protein